MGYIESLDIVKQWKRLFEDFSGLKLTFLSTKWLEQLQKDSCIVHCNEAKSCPIDFSEIKQYLSPLRKFYICSCPLSRIIIFVPIHIGNRLTTLVSITGGKRSQANKKSISALARFVSEAMNYICRHELPLANSLNSKKADHTWEMLEKTILYIQQNYYQRDLCLKRVAMDNNISYYYLSHIFKKYLDINFIEYLTHIRIEKSIKLLKNLKLTISQVSYAVGYNDPGYFCKAFKQNAGYSPVDFRRKFCKFWSNNGKREIPLRFKRNILMKSFKES